MTEKEQQPVTPEIPTEAADKPESDNPPKNENRRGANQAERERTIAQNRQRLRFTAAAFQCRCCKQLHSAIPLFGMRIHNTTGYFYQLSDMPC